nr:type I 3-dehydroquinate dehydratase [Candidatus Prometheoarchaeum syntrophicum]
MPVFSILKAKLNAKIAVKRNAQYIEFRLDYYKKITEINSSKLSKLVKSVPVPVILTLKEVNEEIQLKIPEQKTIELIKKCIEAKPSFVDIETHNTKDNLKLIYSIAIKNGVGVIFSYHDFKSTPNEQDLMKMVSKIVKKCPSLENSSLNKSIPRSILKMVFFAQTFQDNKTILNICNKLDDLNINFICFNMGKKGLFSRIFSITKGAIISYAKLEETLHTAPGQISIKRFYYLYKKGEQSASKEIAGF